MARVCTVRKSAPCVYNLKGGNLVVSLRHFIHFSLYPQRFHPIWPQISLTQMMIKAKTPQLVLLPKIWWWVCDFLCFIIAGSHLCFMFWDHPSDVSATVCVMYVTGPVCRHPKMTWACKDWHNCGQRVFSNLNVSFRTCRHFLQKLQLFKFYFICTLIRYYHG